MMVDISSSITMKRKKNPRREKIAVSLTTSDVQFLEEFTKRGDHNVRVVTRARILLLSHQGKTNHEIVDALACAPRIICNVRRRYKQRASATEAIKDAPRPGQPKKITPRHEAFVVATACTDAPPGHDHWTVSELKKTLLARYKRLRSVSEERVRQMLVAAALKPWREKMWCVPNLTPLFRERMDDILSLYIDPLPEGHEVRNFDETPKQLLSTPHGGRSATPRHVRRLDHEYKRNGTRNIFVAVAPFRGKRTVTVTERRTTEDTARFLWEYCMGTHRNAKHMHLVLDNLNTHKEAALRAVFGMEKSAAFFAHVTLRFTPYHASWLNRAELEIIIV